MNVFYRRYKLTPLRRANRLTDMEEKSGIHLMLKKGGGKNFADYFPHVPLGDPEVEEFLEDFRNQNHDYFRKVFHLLINDDVLRSHKMMTFYSHQLWDGKSEVQAEVIKYKLLVEEDLSFLPFLAAGKKVRLDANALFSRQSFREFVNKIPAEHRSCIEYIEDPLPDTDWKDLLLPTAADFVEGTPHNAYIFKPNCEFMPTEEKKVVFSSYMGSDLGRWHAYCELLEKGDLAAVHGIVTPTLYKNEKQLFRGDHGHGFMPSPKDVKAIYDELHLGEWKLLCSM